VLCDRGGRELPVAPDFVGRKIDLREDEVLDVIMDSPSEERAVIRKRGTGADRSGGEG